MPAAILTKKSYPESSKITLPKGSASRKIRAEKIRLIDFQGKQVGIVSKKEGLELAEKNNLDLVEVAPDANPPVCRIIDYGKYQYLLDKKSRSCRKEFGIRFYRI